MVLALNIVIVESVLSAYVPTLRVNVGLRSRVQVENNVSYSMWLTQASVCGSSVADHSCLILFLYTCSVILIVI